MGELGSRWACTSCFHSNDSADPFCGACRLPRNSKSNQTTSDTPSGMELTSAITVTLVALFLSGLLLVAVSLFGGKMVSIVTNAYAKLSSTPRPEANPVPTIEMSSSSNTSVRFQPTVPLLREVEPTPSVPSLKIPEISAFDRPSIKPAVRSTATVISENANLRVGPSMTGELIMTIPQGSSVKILRQTGPWFRVSFGSTKGWLHGNTIEFELDESPNVY